MQLSLKHSIRNNHQAAVKAAVHKSPSGNADIDVLLDKIGATVYDNGGRDSNKAKGQIDAFDPQTGTTVRASIGEAEEFDFEQTRTSTEKSFGKTTITTDTTFWSVSKEGDLVHTKVRKTQEKPSPLASIFMDESTTSVAESYTLSAAEAKDLKPHKAMFDALRKAEKDSQTRGLIFGG